MHVYSLHQMYECPSLGVNMFIRTLLTKSYHEYIRYIFSFSLEISNLNPKHCIVIIFNSFNENFEFTVTYNIGNSLRALFLKEQ